MKNDKKDQADETNYTKQTKCIGSFRTEKIRKRTKEQEVKSCNGTNYIVIKHRIDKKGQ